LCGSLCDDLAARDRQIEERIELQLKERGAPAADPTPRDRTREDAIEPWELVSV
jgi:hypothetical protein